VGSLTPFLHVLNVVADGPRASVFLAQWTLPDGGFVALKRSRITVGSDPRREAETDRLLELDHPHVATVFDLGRDADGHPYVVTEYVPGVSFPERWRRDDLRLSERLELVRQLVDTLAYLHGGGLTHSNLKPTNVLVADAPVGVKLLDFEAAMPHAVSVGDGPGAAFDPELDVRGLGSLLSSALEGSRDDREPYAELWRISRKALAGSTRERYSTAREIAADLARCLAAAVDAPD